MESKTNVAPAGVALRQLRKKYLRPLVEMPLNRAITHIEMLPLRKLMALKRAMESCTSTNCWWAEMEGKRHYLALVEAWIANRTRNAQAEQRP